jgi:hypothetical protein
MKKLVVALAAAFMSVLGLVMLPAQNAAAADCRTHFLGLPAWYDGLTEGSDCHIKSPQDADGVKTYVWTIVLNIVCMVLGVVGYVAIGFVMWGGIQYMLAQGDPGKVARGKKTILNAIIGLIITMSASILSGAISGIVSGASTGSGKAFFGDLFGKVFFWSGVIAVIMIVYGGIQYITSVGNPAGIAKAKNTILYSLVGLIIVIAAAAIVSTVVGAIPE